MHSARLLLLLCPLLAYFRRRASRDLTLGQEATLRHLWPRGAYRHGHLSSRSKKEYFARFGLQGRDYDD